MNEVPRTWRPRAFGRAVAWVFILGFIAAVVAGSVVLVSGGEPGVLLAILLGGHPLLLIAVLGSLRPFVSADTEGLRVQNPVRRFDLPWAEIAEVLPGYSGLEITTRDDEVVIAWAVQKSNLAGWLKRRTRADDVADLLQNAAAGHEPDSSTTAGDLAHPGVLH
jgi:hypothetical protein